MESTSYLAIEDVDQDREYSNHSVALSSSSPVKPFDGECVVDSPGSGMEFDDFLDKELFSALNGCDYFDTESASGYSETAESPESSKRLEGTEIARTFDAPPLVEVNGEVPVKHLVKLIEAMSKNHDSVWIRLNTNQSSIRVMRKSMKAVERHLKRAKVPTKRICKVKIKSFVECNQSNYRTSTDESDEDEDEKGGKRLRKCKIERGSYVEMSDMEVMEADRKELRYPCQRGVNIWIYCGNFFRGGLLVKKEIPKDLCLNKKSYTKRRIEIAKSIRPDPEIFGFVSNQIPWNESDYRCLLEPKMARDTILRVLKGMSLGRLYNIDYSRLSFLFKGLIVEDDEGKSSCPLCRKIYVGRPMVISHIEGVHTNFTAFCAECGHWFSRSEACARHRCKRKSAPYSVKLYQGQEF